MLDYVLVYSEAGRRTINSPKKKLLLEQLEIELWQ